MKKRPQERRLHSTPDRRLHEARLYFESGRHSEAESILRQVITENPRHLHALFALAIVAAETGKREDAKARISQMLAIDPRHPPALCWMSFLLLQDGNIEAATEHASRAIALDPRNPTTLAAMGRCLTASGRNAEAVAYLRSSVELNPNDPAILYELADALFKTDSEIEGALYLRRAVSIAPTLEGERQLAEHDLRFGRLEDAEDFCRRALKRDPEQRASHELMAKILTEQFKAEEAEFHWRRAEELSSEPGSVSYAKALSLTAIGHFDEAADQMKRSIEANSCQGAAYLGMVSVKRITQDDLDWIRQMEETLAECTLNDAERVDLLYALGKSFDNLGEFEQAIGYFDRANALKLQNVASFDRQALSREIDAKIAFYTPELFRQNASVGLPSALPIAVVGMMRSGTTFVEQILTCHPQIGGAGEQHFWGDHEPTVVNCEREAINQAGLRESGQAYIKLLTSIAPGYPHVIDKNPANLQVVGSLHLGFPNAKIVYTRRNAADTALSIWMTPMRTIAPFVNDRVNIVHAIKEYRRLLMHWSEVIPADRFFEIGYEKLVSQPERLIRQLVEFCGLEWTEACLHPELNKRRVITPSLWQVRQPVYVSSAERWRKYKPWLGAFEELIELD